MRSDALLLRFLRRPRTMPLIRLTVQVVVEDTDSEVERFTHTLDPYAIEGPQAIEFRLPRNGGYAPPGEPMLVRVCVGYERSKR